MSWATEEMCNADFGDARLKTRAALLLERLGAQPGHSIPAACRGWSETLAAYRFFDNDKVTFDEVLASHRAATLQRMACSPVVLLVQDTTEFDKKQDLGPKGIGTIRDTKKTSRRLHPTIAFTPERICLGVVDAHWWNRDEPSPRPLRRTKGVDEKESIRWLDSYAASCAVQGQLPETLVVNLADAEGDLYEWFLEHADAAPSTQAQWIVRAAQNRRIQGGQQGKLREELLASSALGSIEVRIGARPGRPARTAHVTLRSARLELRPPARKDGKLPSVSINAVMAREEAAPAGVEALEWVLLTSLPVTSLEQSATVIEWYGVRWCIEIYFNVLKNGCQTQRLQLEEDDRLLPCIGLYLIIAWRVLYSLMLSRQCPDLSCEMVFDPHEWRAAYIVVKHCPPPEEPPLLGEVILLVARLGGYLGRKHDGPPGPKSIWVGLGRLQEFVVALEAQSALGGSCV